MLRWVLLGFVIVLAIRLKEAGEVYTYEAALDRVIDGDTVVLDVDLGFDVWRNMTIRLAGIDTPERGEVGFVEAKDYVINRLIGAHTITIHTEKDRGKFGRYIAHVFYDGMNLNQELLRKGFAEVYGEEK